MADEIKLIFIRSRKGLKRYAVVDAQDFDVLMPHLWNLSGRYVTTGSRESYITLQQKVFELQGVDVPSGYYIDHIDRNPLNNTFSNLRLATPFQSAWNTSPRGNREYKGTTLNKLNNRWIALIMANGKKYYLGHYESEHIAAQVYNEAAKILHGEFAYLNEISGQHRIDVSTLIDVPSVIKFGLRNTKRLASGLEIAPPRILPPIVISPQSPEHAQRIHQVIIDVLSAQNMPYDVAISQIQFCDGEHGVGWYAPVSLTSSENFYFKSVDAAEEWAARIVKKIA